MRHHKTLSILILATCLLASEAHAITFNRVISFGDSLSDVGNISSATLGIQPGGSYFNGRFSNGPVWVEALANRTGIPATTHSRAGGNNYAHGGTTTADDFFSVSVLFFRLDFPNAGRQIIEFLDDAPAIQPDDLVTLWAGANDLFNISGSLGSQGAARVDEMLANTTTSLNRLINAGARHIVVPNLPALGQTPDFGGGTQLIDTFVESYNTQLTDLLDGFNTGSPATIYPLDVFEIGNTWVDDPGRFGFTNTTDAYLSNPVGDPNSYVFFDGVHPTARAHAHFGQAAWQLILGGDMDGNGVLNAGDLRTIENAIGSTNPLLITNVNADLVVDVLDAQHWLTELYGTLPGDFNLDRRVDLIDLSILATNFGGSGLYTFGNATFDDAIDLIDLSLLATNFGADLNPIPEPVSMLLLLGLLCSYRKATGAVHDPIES